MSQVLSDALAAAQQRTDQLLPLLKQWVGQNSFSGDLEGVNAMGSMLLEAFELPGLSVERRGGRQVGDHFCWRTAAWQGAADRRILLIGHHDTVFPPGTFEVFERDGDTLRGPGVLDMKGGLLVVHAAISALAEVGALAELPLAFVCVGDEEIGSVESRPFLEDIARGARAAMVFEAGRAKDMIITQRKGTGRFEVAVQGRAAHAGNHHADGVNAIRALAQFVDQVEQETNYELGVTVNVGTIEGGTSANTVAAHAACEIDFRFERARDGEELVSRVDRLARGVGGATGASFLITGGIRRRPLERSELSAALYARYAACAGAAGLSNSECPLIGGGSDANTVSAIGVPSIDGLGPRGRGFHTHDEFIEVSSLPLKIDALIRLLLSFRDDQ